MIWGRQLWRPEGLKVCLLNLLSHPLIRRALYYLLCVCLVLEEYLIRTLLEEG